MIYFSFLFLLFMIGAMISITLFSFKGEIIMIETNGEEFKKKNYPDRKFYASDGTEKDFFGKSCSIVSSTTSTTTKDKEKESFLVVVGAGGKKAAAPAGAHYIFQLDGTELHKLSSAFPHLDNENVKNNKKKNEEKIKITVRTRNGAGVAVFSPLDGNFEREINVCEDKRETNNKDDVGKECYSVFQSHEDLIVISGSNENGILYVYNTNNGKLLHKINITEGGSSSSSSSTERIQDVAISAQYIISTTQSKTYVYSYSYYETYYVFLPSFLSSSSIQIKKFAEISKGGTSVATSGDRIVIANYKANLGDGMAFLYTTDGTYMRELDRYEITTSESYFGFDVDMNNEKIVIGAPFDDHDKGSVFLYSTKTGQFLGKKTAPDAENGDHFGASICVVGSISSSSFYMVVGATGVDDKGRDSGAAYLVSFFSDDVLEMDK